MTTTTPVPDAPAGLKGLVVAETALGDVRGNEGFYHYRQYSAPDLARHRSLEDVWHLLLDGTLPDAGRRAELADQLAPFRPLSPVLLRALPVIAADSDSVVTGLRTALSHHASTLGLPPRWTAAPTSVGTRRWHSARRCRPSSPRSTGSDWGSTRCRPGPTCPSPPTTCAC